jgi:hypothetical protein
VAVAFTKAAVPRVLVSDHFKIAECLDDFCVSFLTLLMRCAIDASDENREVCFSDTLALLYYFFV